MAAGVTLDGGALIAFDRGDRRAVALLARAREQHQPIHVPVGALGQAWRDGRRQARLARLLGSDATEVVALDDRGARGVVPVLTTRRSPRAEAVLHAARPPRLRMIPHGA